MSKVVLSLGLMVVLTLIVSVYQGYTALTDAATTLTASVKHVIAGRVMVPANQTVPGGYVNEGKYGQNLQLNLSALGQGVADQLPRTWPGSQVQSGSHGWQWTLPSRDARGWNIAGPITIAPLAESSALPPTLTTTVSIPIAVPTLMGTWRGTLRRAVVLPLAGQTAPNQFVRYQ